jgi:hypothetical protein
MPVALPQAGSHAVSVGAGGVTSGTPQAATLTVDAMGWSLDPAPPAVGPVRIAFGRD